MCLSFLPYIYSENLKNENFLKKVCKTFGGYLKCIYLCIRFPRGTPW